MVAHLLHIPSRCNPQHSLQFPDPAKHPEWNGTNRRLVLAKWMVSPENPLVSRVFVNRVWQWHFGEGIVRSVDNFGAQGEKPSNPQLLDYLAVTFQEHNWDLKWLTKQIMLSPFSHLQGPDHKSQGACCALLRNLIVRKING